MCNHILSTVLIYYGANAATERYSDGFDPAIGVDKEGDIDMDDVPPEFIAHPVNDLDANNLINYKTSLDEHCRVSISLNFQKRQN